MLCVCWQSQAEAEIRSPKLLDGEVCPYHVPAAGNTASFI